MAEPAVLLTITEVVARFRDAGVCATNESRRSYVHQLMKGGALDDRLVLAPGRIRSSKNEARIEAGSVDQFLASRFPFAPTARTRPGITAVERTATQELTARIDLLMRERQSNRVTLQQQLHDHENELFALKQKILDLEHQIKLSDIDASTIRGELSDEAGTRHTYESVIMQLVGPKDLGDLLDPD